MITIKDLLEIDSIKGVRIVAGLKGIHNPINIVNIMENPDAFDWLSPNELLLSTGYIIKDNEDIQNSIIKELSELNCSGLCIKIKRYFDKIPQNMIDQANKYGLPLLELPFEYNFSNVISIFNEKASGRYDLINRKTLDMHNALFRIALEGGGIEEISSKLAKTINNPIIFLDREWNLLHYTDLKENGTPLKSCLILDKNRPIFTKEFTNSIPQNINKFKSAIKRTFYIKDLEIKCRVLPVAVANYVYGYIVVWQTVSQLTAFDYTVLEKASTIMALDRIKKREIEEVSLRIKQDFFDDLLTGKITSTETLKTLCDLHGLNANYMYYCFVITIEHEEVDNYEDMVVRKYSIESKARKCVDFVHQLSHKASGEITCFHRNNRIIVLVGQKTDRSSVTINEAKSFAIDLHEVLVHEIRDTTFHIGIGRQYQNINLLYKSFSEANEAIRLMQQNNETRNVSHFEDHSIYHFLDSNIKSAELEDFFLKYLGKINDHDISTGTSYLITLENYFIHNLNISEAAKAMFIHRNTFIYRISKIKEILNSDLKHSEELLQIQIALKIYRILYKDQAYL